MLKQLARLLSFSKPPVKVMAVEDARTVIASLEALPPGSSVLLARSVGRMVCTFQIVSEGLPRSRVIGVGSATTSEEALIAACSEATQRLRGG